MHKGVILLVKAEDRDEATERVIEFLEDFGDGDVWDWYVIGGRWSGVLNSKHHEFDEMATKYLKSITQDPNGYITTKLVDLNMTKIQEMWESFGLKGDNPYKRNRYVSEPHSDDIMPLSDCINVVEKWRVNIEESVDKTFADLVAHHANYLKDGNPMSGYYADIYRNLVYDLFSFESNVYDIEHETNNPSRALSEPTLWWAVMVDLHN